MLQLSFSRTSAENMCQQEHVQDLPGQASYTSPQGRAAKRAVKRAARTRQDNSKVSIRTRYPEHTSDQGKGQQQQLGQSQSLA